MGQEIVYCFKCQKRIHGNDYAKGLAYQVENNFCCSSCAVVVLETLPPKAKEQLLAKMFKSTQDRQSAASSSAKTSANPAPASSTGRIPHATPRPMKVAPPSSSGLMMAGIVGAIVAVILVVIFVSSGGSAPPPAPPTVTPKLPPPVAKIDPGPGTEEKRRAESAKETMKKAREFALSNPKDLEGQLRQWRLALIDAEHTGYEVEARRETEKAEARNKEALAQELADLERDARALASKKEFKAAKELVDRARSKRAAPDWTSRIDALGREFEERALAGPPWRPIFDGRSNAFIVREAAEVWTFDNGTLTRDLSKPDQAAQTREDFGDGEFRFRFTAERCSGAYFACRQASGAQTRVIFSKPALEALAPGPHEIIFICRGLEVTATFDGAAIPVTFEGKVQPRGRLQFNNSEGNFRLLAVEMRDLP
jgi:hypothetical protein